MKPSQRNTQLVDVAETIRMLESAAGRYFPEFNDANSCKATPVHAKLRSNSEVYEFEIQCGQASRRVFVKSPVSQRVLRAADKPSESNRPRVTPRPDPRLKGRHEFAALTAIHSHFLALDPAAFGVIRPLELVEDGHMFVMEKGPSHNLSDYLKRFTRLRAWRQEFPMHQSFQSTGRWLREFHEMTPLSHTESRGQQRQEFVDTCDQFWSFIAARTRRSKRLEQLWARFQSACLLLPTELPLGVLHGDYAPRNILVEANGRVTGFDTQARWRAPIYEDIGHFLVALNASGLQVSTRGYAYSQAVLRQLEAAFLSGYFAAPNSSTSELIFVRLFECQRLLEWWTSLYYVSEQARGLRKLGKLCRVFLWRSSIAAYLERCVCEIESLANSHSASRPAGTAGDPATSNESPTAASGR